MVDDMLWVGFINSEWHLVSVADLWVGSITLNSVVSEFELGTQRSFVANAEKTDLDKSLKKKSTVGVDGVPDNGEHLQLKSGTHVSERMRRNVLNRFRGRCAA